MKFESIKTGDDTVGGKELSTTNDTYHFAYIGSLSITTRSMYSAQVISLKNRFAIRILKPIMKQNHKVDGES